MSATDETPLPRIWDGFSSAGAQRRQESVDEIADRFDSRLERAERALEQALDNALQSRGIDAATAAPGRIIDAWVEVKAARAALWG